VGVTHCRLQLQTEAEGSHSGAMSILFRFCLEPMANTKFAQLKKASKDGPQSIMRKIFYTCC
jgi:hypothetical protein